MDQQQNAPNYLLGAIAGGALMGIPSAIPFVSCCCLIWAIGGGTLSAYLASRSAVRFGPQEGVLAGLAAAVPGTVFYALIAIPLQLIMVGLTGGGGAQQVPPGVPPEIARMLQPGSPVGMILGVGLAFGVFLVLGAIGGVIGGLIAKKEDLGPGDVYDAPPKDGDYPQGS